MRSLLAMVSCLVPTIASAASFDIPITNNSSTRWHDGVIALYPGGGAQECLIDVGRTPRKPNPFTSTFLYGDQSCDKQVEDDGDANLLITRQFLTLGVNAWIVPALDPGASTEVTIDADPGDVMSFVARVEGSDDDIVMMHAIGDDTDCSIDLFNQVDLPLFAARYDIGGYDLNSTSATDGTGASCAQDCPVGPAANCWVAPGNTTVGADAGGSQVLPVEPAFTKFPGYALSPQAGTFYANGVGSPSVVARKLHGDFVMVFETNLGAAADCPPGQWGVGLATSPDGWNWTVQPNPILEPAAGTYYSCVVAHPSITLDPGGTDIHMWFKSEQTTSCDALNPPAWGCNRYTGVGYAVIDGTSLTSIQTVAATPIQFAGTGAMGFPTVARVNNTWTMLVQDYPDLFRATAASPAGPWTLDATPVMQAGVTAWSQTELFNPALVCEGDVSLPTYPYTNWFGGRTLSGPWGAIIDGGIGQAISTDAVSWFIGITPFTITNNDEFRHWDVARVGSEYLMWFAEKDASGKNNVGLAGSTDTWDLNDVATRVCPQPAWW